MNEYLTLKNVYSLDSEGKKNKVPLQFYSKDVAEAFLDTLPLVIEMLERVRKKSGSLFSGPKAARAELFHIEEVK